MSLKPGTPVQAEVKNPGALATGVVQNPFTPVEFGRTAAASLYETADSGADLPDFGDGSAIGGSNELTALAVTGDAAANNGDTKTYTATVSGTDVNTSAGTFLWTVEDVAATIATAAAASTDITFNATGTAKVKCSYTEDGVTGSPQAGELEVTVS